MHYYSLASKTACRGVACCLHYLFTCGAPSASPGSCQLMCLQLKPAGPAHLTPKRPNAHSCSKHTTRSPQYSEYDNAGTGATLSYQVAYPPYYTQQTYIATWRPSSGRPRWRARRARWWSSGTGAEGRPLTSCGGGGARGMGQGRGFWRLVPRRRRQAGICRLWTLAAPCRPHSPRRLCCRCRHASKMRS